MNGGPVYHGNGFITRDTRETQSIGELRRSRSTQDIYRQQSGHFDGSKWNWELRYSTDINWPET